MDKCRDMDSLMVMIVAQFGPFQRKSLQNKFELFNKLQKIYWTVTDNKPSTPLTRQVLADGELKFMQTFFNHTGQKVWGPDAPDDARVAEMHRDFHARLRKIPVAGAILLNPGLNKTLLVGFDTPEGTRIYNPPRGKRDEGESLAQTAIREVREETGLDIAPFLSENEFIRIQRPYKGEMVLFIVVVPLAGVELLPPPPLLHAGLQNQRDNKECTELRWFDLQDNALLYHRRLSHPDFARDGTDPKNVLNEDIFMCLLRWAQCKIQNQYSNRQANDKIIMRPIRQLQSNGTFRHWPPHKENAILTKLIHNFTPTCAGLLSCLFPPSPNDRLCDDKAFISYTEPTHDCDSDSPTYYRQNNNYDVVNQNNSYNSNNNNNGRWASRSHVPPSSQLEELALLTQKTPVKAAKPTPSPTPKASTTEQSISVDDLFDLAQQPKDDQIDVDSLFSSPLTTGSNTNGGGGSSSSGGNNINTGNINATSTTSVPDNIIKPIINPSAFSPLAANTANINAGGVQSQGTINHLQQQQHHHHHHGATTPATAVFSPQAPQTSASMTSVTSQPQRQYVPVVLPGHQKLGESNQRLGGLKASMKTNLMAAGATNNYIPKMAHTNTPNTTAGNINTANMNYSPQYMMQQQAPVATPQTTTTVAFQQVQQQHNNNNNNHPH